MQYIPFTTKEEYLANVLKCAYDEYQQINRKTRLLKQVRFEIYKSLEGYDFSNINILELINIEGLREGEYIDRTENLVFYGLVGTGKTHLAIALGIEACNRGKKVSFFW